MCHDTGDRYVSPKRVLSNQNSESLSNKNTDASPALHTVGNEIPMLYSGIHLPRFIISEAN